MPRITYNQTPGSSFSNYATQMQFGSFVSASDDTYVYTSAYNMRVTMQGENIVVNDEGRFVSGTITEISFSPRGGPFDSVLLRIDRLDLDGRDVLGRSGVNVPTDEYAWKVVLDGETTLTSTGTGGRLDLGTDAPFHNSGFLVGEDSNVNVDLSPTSFVMGGVAYVRNDAVFRAGDMTFRGEASTVDGDSYQATNTSVVVGGDDRIVWSSGTDGNQHASNTIRFSGDVGRIQNEATLIGGDDVINLRDARTSGSITIAGESRSVSGTGVIVGGDDWLRGSAMSDNVIYGDVNSASGFRFSGGNDVIIGGNGDDMLYGDVGSVTHEGAGDGNDKIYGGRGDDLIVGNGGNDIMYQGGTSATVYGNAGRDQFRAQADGAHTFYGGSGEDLINYYDADTGIRLDLEDSSYRAGWAADDVLTGIENVFGSATRGDFIYGDKGNNVIVTFGGQDYVNARGGNDLIRTGTGNDRIDAGEGRNQYYGGQGYDLLSYEDSGTGVYVDLQKGAARNGYATGDKIDGIEHLFGSDGGNDVLGGNAVGNDLRGRAGNDRLYGRDGVDSLRGDGNNDQLYGGNDFDRLYGGTGNDYLEGGRDDDYLWGGSGADTFHFNKGDSVDRIRDFQDNVDTIEIDGYARGFDALDNAQQRGNDVYINLGGGDWVVVEDMTISALQNDLVMV